MDCDSDFEMALQSIQRDINCLTHDERGVRKEAIVKLREALLASARIIVDPVRRFRVPKNPVALRTEADFKSEARAFMLQCGDTIEALETCMVQGRERVHFKWQDLDCWASLKAGDGGILLEELPGAKPGVVGTVTAQPGLLAFLLEAVHIPMIRCLMDSVEKCRELTADALIEIIAIADDVNQIFEVCVPVLTERVGLKQIEESAEEIRLRLVTLLTAFVASHKLNPELLASKLDALCTVLKKMSADPFPEIKKACADCAISLVAEDPVNMRHHTPSIAKVILLNTGHQHSKVRNISVSALGALVSNGAEAAFEDLAPQLLVLSRDHSSSVRETVAKITGGWLSLYIGDRELCPHLLRLLLAGMADEAAAVSAVAVKGIIDASKLYREARVEEGKWPDMESGGTTGDDIAPAPRVMIREYLPGILPVLIKELSDWTSKTRIHAAGALTVLLEYSGDAVTSHLDSLLPSLYHAIGDDEIEIVKMITRCVEKLGVTVSINSWLPLVLEDALKQSVGGSVVTLKFSVLCLTALLRGLRLSPERMTMKPQLTNITAFLSNPVLCCNPTLEVTYAVFQATSEVVESIEIFECDEEDERRIFIALLHAAAMTSHSEMQEEAVNEIARLANVLKLESVEALYKRHFSNVLSLLVADGSYRNWRSDSPGRSLFDVLVRGSGSAVGGQLHSVLEVFSDTLQPEREPEMRMSFLVLLESLCKNYVLHDALKGKADGDGNESHMGTILRKMVLPNLIWKPGRVAAKLRKATCTVLLTVAVSELATPEDYIGVSDKLFPPLLSALDDDYEASTRALVCKLFKYVFVTLRGYLSEDICRTLYADLLKRLDDNSDDIRIDAAGALSELLPSVPLPEGVAIIEYTAQTCLIHLDDTNEDIRMAVYPTLQVAANLCPSIVRKKTEEAMKRQRKAGAALSEALLAGMKS